MSKTITANQAKAHHCVHSAHISCLWKVLMERNAWVSVNVLEMFPGSKHRNSCDKPIYLYTGMTVCVAVTVSMLLCTHVMLILPPPPPLSLSLSCFPCISVITPWWKYTSELLPPLPISDLCTFLFLSSTFLPEQQFKPHLYIAGVYDVSV